MKTHRFRLAAALTAAMIVLTALTGCMTGPRKPSSPAESAVTVDGEIRGLFIHATGQDLIIQSPYDAGTVAQSLDQIMSYAAENGINTVFMDVHDAKGSALYTSDYMPTSELMLDEKGKNSGGDIVYEAVRAAKKQNIQVYAVINTTYIAESLGIASEDHPAVYDSSLSYEDGNGALRWNTSKKDSMSTLTNIARELCYNYGISGLVLNDDGTDPQTMAKVFSAIDQAVDELGTGKKIGVYTQVTPQGLESGNNALNAFSEEGYAPDFLLADLQGTTVSGDYTQLLNDVSAATEGRCDLITVHNMNLISSDSGADGKLYADPYEPAYQIYENRGHSIRGTAIEGYSALRSSKYYLMDLMNSLYDSNYDICPYELTVEPGFGSTLQSTFAAGNRVLDILDEEPVVADIEGRPELEFTGASAEDVRFDYGGETILDGVSADIPRGSIVGITGRSGSGKSTLLKLFMRFWEAKGGAVKVSGVSVNGINTSNLRDMESFVTQETQLFHDSIRANLLIAKLDATDAELVAACKKASVHDFIMTLPRGYDTPVGELGDTLSGGERQRLGLARAFLHEADFMLLDEPTSNLDSLNEAVILRSLRTERGGRTVVLVSHRASTMRIAEKVYSVEHGRLS